MNPKYKLKEVISNKVGFGGGIDYNRSVNLTIDTLAGEELTQLAQRLNDLGPMFEEPMEDLMKMVLGLKKLISSELGDKSYNLDTLDDSVFEYVIQQLEESRQSVGVLLVDIKHAGPDYINENTFNEIVDVILGVMGAISEVKDLITSNTHDANKQQSIGFRVTESSYGVQDMLQRCMEQIKLEHGPEQYRILQTYMSKQDEEFVETWLKENGYIEPQTTSFQEHFVREQIKKAIEETQNIFQAGKPFLRRSDQDHHDDLEAEKLEKEKITKPEPKEKKSKFKKAGEKAGFNMAGLK